MQEISDETGIEVCKRPILDRCSSDTVFAEYDPGKMRVIIAGASHAARLVGGLAENGLQTVNLTKPGLTFDELTVSKLCTDLKNLKAGPEDFLILDPVSNSTFCGTDSKGNHVDPEKVEGKWHIRGQLVIRSKSYVRTVLKNLSKILDSFPELKILAMLPIPRYVSEKCCSDPEHITNFGSATYLEEISDELEGIDDLVRGWAQSRSCAAADTIDYRMVLDEPAADLGKQSLDGSHIWADDPVHAVQAVYTAVSLSVISSIDELGGDVSEPQRKRPRLESVVVRPKKRSDQLAKPKPQGWSSGVLPDPGVHARGGTRGGQRGSQRGGRPPRGWPRFTRWRAARGRRPY
jgi:hypothetical protein